MLNLEYVRMFVIAAEQGSFSACARKTGKVQSAVSQAINNLEIDLGVTLFDRTSRQPVLTEAGTRLLKMAQGLLVQADELSKTAAAISQSQETRLSIAIDDGMLTPAIYALIARLESRFSTLELDFATLPSHDIALAVESGEIDLGLMFSEIESMKTTDFFFVANVPFVAVCHPSHPLAEASKISSTALLQHKQIAVRGSAKRESQFLISMASNVWWCSGYQHALSLLLQGIGWAYLPAFMAKDALTTGKLKPMDMVFDHKTWSVPVDIITPRGRQHGPVVQWFSNELKKTLATEF